MKIKFQFLWLYTGRLQRDFIKNKRFPVKYTSTVCRITNPVRHIFLLNRNPGYTDVLGDYNSHTEPRRRFYVDRSLCTMDPENYSFILRPPSLYRVWICGTLSLDDTKSKVWKDVVSFERM